MPPTIDTKLFELLRLVRLNSFGFFFVSFIVPIVAYQNLNANGFQMGLLFSLQIFGATLSSPIAGVLADKHTRRGNLMLGGSVGRLVSYMVIYAAIIDGNYWIMVGGTGLLGFSAGFFWNPLKAIIADGTHLEHRSEAYGIESQQSGFGMMIGSFIGFTILGFAEGFEQGPEWRYAALIIYGFCNLYAGYRALRLIPNVPRLDVVVDDQDVTENGTEGSIKPNDALQPNFGRGHAAVMAGFACLLGIFLVEGMVGALVTPFLNVYLLKNITDSPTLVSMVYLPAGIISLSAAPRLGRIADRKSAKLWLPLACVCGAVTTWLLISSSELWQIALLFIIDMTVVTMANLMLVKLMSTVSKARRGSLFGLQSMVKNLGLIAGPLIGGVAWQMMGDKGPFWLSIVVEAVLAGVYFVVLVTFFPQYGSKESFEKKTVSTQAVTSEPTKPTP